MLICGGVNVHPTALEQHLRHLGYIEDCAVCGLPDAEYGQVVRLYLVLNKATALETIHKDLSTLLPKAQRPREVVLLESIPRTALGKIRRHLLQ
jgi:acyl-CoA synthetase (AMP-forming)/AMP-acid ligase II